MVNTAFVSFTAFISGCHKLVNNLQSLVGSHAACRQTKDVGVEETARVLRQTDLPSNRGTHARMGVGCHAHAVAGETETDT